MVIFLSLILMIAGLYMCLDALWKNTFGSLSPKFKVGDKLIFCDTEEWENTNLVKITRVGKKKYAYVFWSFKTNSWVDQEYYNPFEVIERIYEKSEG